MCAAEDLAERSAGSRAHGPGSVLLVTGLWGRDGGVAAHVKESAAALARAGLEVRVLAARVDTDERGDGVSVEHRPQLLEARASARDRLGVVLADPPDVAHVHQLDDHAIVTALRARAPVVISAHGFPGCTSGVYYFRPGEECTRAHGPGCIPNLLFKGCAHTRYRRTLPAKYAGVTRGLAMFADADLVVSYSSAVDRHLGANGLTSRAVVPYFPTMSPRAVPDEDGRRRVVFAGRLVLAKGVDVLIRAIADVDAELVVCGDGQREPRLRQLASRLGVERRVHFRGWMDADRLADEVAGASVLAVPSLWPEPFGIVGIEAFAAGRPAVGSATGGIVDWLEDGVSGTTVPPGDVGALARALARLLDDPQLRRTMGRAGKALVAERFSAERHVAEITHAYRRALDGWRARPAPLRPRQAA
jgi:glycosyltransferase involved in cell wall biosynthesis